MEIRFNPDEIRVLGCLIEKRLSTPGSYPLTLKSLVTACNQSSNRDPVVNYDQYQVNDVLISTRQRDYTTRHSASGSRVPKFGEKLCERLDLKVAASAVLAELMLRGPQTPGELRQRTSRMHNFDELSAVESVLEKLCGRGLVVQLPKQPGKREARYAQLFGGPVEAGVGAADGGSAEMSESAAETQTLAQRVATLEAQMAEVLARLGE